MVVDKGQFRMHSICPVLRIQRSVYCAWKKKRPFEESQNIYGSPRVYCEIREDDVLCGEKRIARLMHQSQR